MLGFPCSRAQLMPRLIADPPSSSCSRLFLDPGVQIYQTLTPDLFSPNARDARGRFAKGSSGIRAASPIAAVRRPIFWPGENP